jgi:hypothetical protein
VPHQYDTGAKRNVLTVYGHLRGLERPRTEYFYRQVAGSTPGRNVTSQQTLDKLNVNF